MIQEEPSSNFFWSYLRSGHSCSHVHELIGRASILFSLMIRFENSFSYYVKRKVTDKGVQEVDELVDEWIPEPLGQPLDAREQADLASVPIIAGPNGPKPKLASNGKSVTNLASFNFTGLAGNEQIKTLAVETLRKYGLGSCGPPGFYGTLGA
jgi:serine palmitoyltransferase